MRLGGVRHIYHFVKNGARVFAVLYAACQSLVCFKKSVANEEAGRGREEEEEERERARETGVAIASCRDKGE